MHVERVGLERPSLFRVSRFLRLDQHRQSTKTDIVQKLPKRLFAETSASDVLVAIDPAAARPLGVVRMKHLQPADSDDAVEGIECVTLGCLVDDVIAGRQ